MIIVRMHHSFDTYTAVKRFMLNGIDEKQAEVIVQTISESRDYDISHLATKIDLIETEKRLESAIFANKNDLIEMEKRLESAIFANRNDLIETEKRLESAIFANKNDLTEVEKRLDNKISNLAVEIEKSKNEMLKWFIGIAITLVGTMTGIMTLLFKHFLH